MRVLHVTRLPVTVTAFLLPLLREHRARGQAVRVACSDGPGVDEIEAEGVPVLHFPLERSLCPLNLSTASWCLTRIVREQRIDWVVTHTPIASAVARLASRMGGARGTIYMAHGLPCAPRMGRAQWLLWYAVERLLGSITEGLITTNRYDHRLALRHGLIRNRRNIFRVNEVGVAADRFDRLRGETDAGAVKRALGIPADEPMVLLLAWTLPSKGVREFLTAALRLVKGGERGYFVIGGQGPLDDEIHAFVEHHGLKGRVQHLGWRRDAHRLMAACDLYVLPTYYPEGMPISILEAMACAKPVVATWHRGCEDEVVDGVTGTLVEPQDADALADAIRTYLADPEQAIRSGLAGRRRINEGFRTDQCTRRIMAAFDTVVGDDGIAQQI
jgi:glycosyltransferase involved in cell wall biosynthesis